MENNREELEYGKVYCLWRGGVFLGEATFVADENIGDSFVREKVVNGIQLIEVVIADNWQEVNPEQYDNKDRN
jgi:hypothetical protein